MSDVWKRMRKVTQARIGLARSGHAISTRDVLEFQRAHADARDAVWWNWNSQELCRKLAIAGTPTLEVSSEISSRADFLKRPDLGRRLTDESRETLEAAKRTAGEVDLVFIVSDGLSGRALDRHFLPFWNVFEKEFRTLGMTAAPLVLAPFSRVAIADPIGRSIGARMAVGFIGERPGLSSNDSLGVYLTYDPKPGRTDADRNCLSNIRPPDGLSYEEASAKLNFLIRESVRLKLSGVSLKEDAPLLIDKSSKSKNS